MRPESEDRSIQLHFFESWQMPIYLLLEASSTFPREIMVLILNYHFRFPTFEELSCAKEVKERIDQELKILNLKSSDLISARNFMNISMLEAAFFPLASPRFTPPDKELISILVANGLTLAHDGFCSEWVEDTIFRHFSKLDGDWFGLWVSAGGSLNFQDRIGETLLHYAVSYLSPEMIAFLIENGADKSIKQKYGRTPLDYVIKDSINPVFHQMAEVLSKADGRPELSSVGIFSQNAVLAEEKRTAVMPASIAKKL